MIELDVAAGWYGSIDAFLSTPASDWLDRLFAHHRSCMRGDPDGAQVTAWKNCYLVLQHELDRLIQLCPAAAEWTIVFEYELPRERGRRPDVVVLAGTSILVVEFKDFSSPHAAHLDQVAAYARDLAHYHAASHQHPVSPFLVLTQAHRSPVDMDGIWVGSPPDLPDALLARACDTSVQPIDPSTWLTADYSPLPSLVGAARIIFRDEPLPQIRRAQSAHVPETIAELVAIAQDARVRGEFHLALVTGVPGAGKTLAGLQFVYENHDGDHDGQRSAVFLSGNGPLVKVLQYALKSTVFVQDVHGFLKQYGGAQHRRPEEHIWVYDEAQRAWDAERVGEKRGHPVSEPEDFLRIGARMGSWAVLVGLIGEGQEIHLGEEAGLGQWADAVRSSECQWTVHAPSKVAGDFAGIPNLKLNDVLDLNTSLRSHVAEDVHLWVRQLLDGDLRGAGRTAERVWAQGFEMYLTDDLEEAKAYVGERYRGVDDKRYGLLASSKARNLERYGIRNGYNFTKNFREGPWYVDPVTSPSSCCAFRDVATEFACQGLELDFPIVCWGDDLTWRGKAWQSPPQPQSKARDPYQLRINSYRVLLTRGRDGFVVFLPNEVSTASTRSALRASGMRVHPAQGQ